MLIGVATSPHAAQAGDVPTFAVDASWPKPLPNNWILGQVGGISADAQGHIWVFQRPRSLTDDEKGRSAQPAAHQMLRPGAAGAGVRQPTAICCAPGADPAKAINGSATNTASRSTIADSSG